MKINWKLRLQNKVVLTSLALGAISLIYQILGAVGVVPSIGESEIAAMATMLINMFVMLGIVTDPTTEGIGDSDQALFYEKPKKEDF